MQRVIKQPDLITSYPLPPVLLLQPLHIKKIKIKCLCLIKITEETSVNSAKYLLFTLLKDTIS